MVIEKRVHFQHNEQYVSSMPGAINCIFTIRQFAGQYMAFVECKNTHGKNKVHFNGNSLWGLGSMGFDDLLDKIAQYGSFPDIERDFSAYIANG